MKRILVFGRGLLMTLLIGQFVFAQSSNSENSVKKENNVFGRIQMFGFAQNLKDYTQSNNRLYLFLKQARIGTEGTYDNLKYYAQIAFGGEDQLATVGLSLLDFSVDIMYNEVDGANTGSVTDGNVGWVQGIVRVQRNFYP